MIDRTMPSVVPVPLPLPLLSQAPAHPPLPEPVATAPVDDDPATADNAMTGSVAAATSLRGHRRPLVPIPFPPMLSIWTPFVSPADIRVQPVCHHHDSCSATGWLSATDLLSTRTDSRPEPWAM
jgi:hypothetical protein